MTEHKYKDGDVAKVLCSDGECRLALYDAVSANHRWRFASGSYRYADESEALPVAVIDPNDRGVVRDLLNAYYKRRGSGGAASTARVTDFAKVLADTIVPAKPSRVWTDGDVIEAKVWKVIRVRYNGVWCSVDGWTAHLSDHEVNDRISRDSDTILRCQSEEKAAA